LRIGWGVSRLGEAYRNRTFTDGELWGPESGRGKGAAGKKYFPVSHRQVQTRQKEAVICLMKKNRLPVRKPSENAVFFALRDVLKE
jgi:hypothetical protein